MWSPGCEPWQPSCPWRSPCPCPCLWRSPCPCLLRRPWHHVLLLIGDIFSCQLGEGTQMLTWWDKREVSTVSLLLQLGLVLEIWQQLQVWSPWSDLQVSQLVLEVLFGAALLRCVLTRGVVETVGKVLFALLASQRWQQQMIGTKTQNCKIALEAH